MSIALALLPALTALALFISTLRLGVRTRGD
jgi:hypothetical protein